MDITGWAARCAVKQAAALGAAGLLAITIAAPARAQVKEVPVEAFGNLPFVTNVQISPDGRHVAIVRRFENRNVALITPLDGGQPAGFQQKDAVIRNIFWASPERALIAMDTTSYVRVYGDTIRLSRLVSVSADGKDMDMLMRRIRGTGRSTGSGIRRGTGDLVPQHQRLLSRKLYRGDKAVVSAWTGRTEQVYQVDLDSGYARVMKSGTDQQSASGQVINYTRSWLAGPDFERWVRWNQDNRTAPAKTIVEFQIGDEDYQLIEEYPVGGDPKYGIIGFGKDRHTLYVTADRPNAPTSLFEYDLKANKLGRLVYERPSEGIRGASIDPDTGAILAAYYTDDQRRQHILDPGLAELQALIDRTFEQTSVNRIVSSTADGKVHIVSTTGPSQPKVFYLINPEKMQAAAVGEAYPDLIGVPMGEVKALTYKARDGLPIRAYLTIPSGREAKDLPTVILPHGGPHARDMMEFDWLAQFLANRGYAVLQPNFRGSTGYGVRFLEAGYGEWGGKMQDDVTDGVRHLIEAGIADPERVCIMGASYGGYAALMGGVKTPDLYRCIISINGVSDLQALLRQAADGGTTLQFWTVSIGDARQDRDKLKATSPAQQADRIKAPVLIVHGKDDQVVEYSHARDMERALRRADKSVDLVTLKGEDHYLSEGDTRIAALKAVDEFLKKHLAAR